MSKKIVIIGAGGHAKVIADIILQNIKHGADLELKGFLDDSYVEDECKAYFGKPVIGKLEKISELKDEAEFVIGIGSNDIRKKISEKYPDLSYFTSIHPTAIIGEMVEIKQGTVIMAGVIVNPYTNIGEHCIINSGAVVEHDCSIGNHVHISPNAGLAGGVEVGDCSWVGMGSSFIQGVKIGGNVITGAGSVVIKDLAKPGIYVGVPAKKMY